MSKHTKEAFNNIKEKLNKKEKKANAEKLILGTSIIIAIIAILIFIFLIIDTKKKLSKNNNELPSFAENLNKEQFKDTYEEVKDQNEMRRFKTYLGDIFYYIDKKNFEEIYARLDDKFKEGFFPKIEVLEDYINGEFPENPGFVIKNFERIGNLYIYIVDIASVNDSRIKTDMKFIFEEYALNDYRFSFSKQ